MRTSTVQHKSADQGVIPWGVELSIPQLRRIANVYGVEFARCRAEDDEDEQREGAMSAVGAPLADKLITDMAVAAAEAARYGLNHRSMMLAIRQAANRSLSMAGGATLDELDNALALATRGRRIEGRKGHRLIASDD